MKILKRNKRRFSFIILLSPSYGGYAAALEIRPIARGLYWWLEPIDWVMGKLVDSVMESSCLNREKLDSH